MNLMLDDVTLEEARARTAAIAPAAVRDELEAEGVVAEVATVIGADGVRHQPVDEPVAQRSTLVPERLRMALARRRAFRESLGILRERSHHADTASIDKAVAAADVDGIVNAVVAHSVSTFLDLECQRPGTLLHGLNHEIEAEIVAAVWSDPTSVLANTSEQSTDPDTAYLRRLATQATTPDGHLFDVSGQPSRAKPATLSLLTTMVPR